MALRNPIYLDLDTLASQAEYHDIDVPQAADIVEKTTRKRVGGGRAGSRHLGIDASRGTDIEYQTSYTLAPRGKATVSRVIDNLTAAGAVTVNPDAGTALSKDDLVELDGTTRITTASVAGKMFYALRRVMADAVDLDSIMALEADDPDVTAQLKDVYLGNELLPIPMLVELTGSGLAQRVYVNLAADHFIDSASANRIEGQLRVLGTVSTLVGGGSEGFLSAETWLLHDWEHMLRRLMMLNVKDTVHDLFTGLGLDSPADDVSAYITGPAVILDAIAIY